MASLHKAIASRTYLSNSGGYSAHLHKRKKGPFLAHLDAHGSSADIESAVRFARESDTFRFSIVCWSESVRRQLILLRAANLALQGRV
jgi:hypothetical protein